LTQSDVDILKDRTKWLNCNLINAGQLLLIKRFPGMHNLLMRGFWRA